LAVRLKALGIPSVTVEGRAARGLLSKPLSFGLLVYLGLEGEVTRDALLGLFWPERAADRARHALSQALYDLRKDLGASWADTEGDLIRTTQTLQVDVLEFQELVDEGRLEAALDLYGGPFLEGFHLGRTHALEEWVEDQRYLLAGRHRVAAESVIRTAWERGDREMALEECRRWVRLAPLEEPGQHLLLRLLARSGQRVEALAQYARYEKTLRDELGLEPMPEVRSFAEEIRSGSPGNNENGGAWIEDDESSTFAALSRPQTSEKAPPGRKPPAPEAPAAPDDEFPDSLQVLRHLGDGSMARVYLAREPHLKRLVAVKLLLPKLAGDGRARLRFEREAQTAARLNHPNICTVHRAGILADGTPYLVMPYVRGSSLAERLVSTGRFDPETVRRVLSEIGSALAAAHRLGIVHRDVRPDNILHEEDTDRFLLSDFGVAGLLETADEAPSSLTRRGEILGHPDYMSPEQQRGEPITDRTDVYSLGVVAFELLTGNLPGPAPANVPGARPSRKTASARALRDFLARSDPELAEAVNRCLNAEPRHRPGAVDLMKWMDGSGPGRVGGIGRFLRGRLGRGRG
jgi:DNA-binding SARP family transcriptional activator